MDQWDGPPAPSSIPFYVRQILNMHRRKDNEPHQQKPQVSLSSHSCTASGNDGRAHAKKSQAAGVQKVPDDLTLICAAKVVVHPSRDSQRERFPPRPQRPRHD